MAIGILKEDKRLCVLEKGSKKKCKNHGIRSISDLTVWKVWFEKGMTDIEFHGIVDKRMPVLPVRAHEVFSFVFL